MKTRLLTGLVLISVLMALLHSDTSAAPLRQPQTWFLQTSCTPNCLYPDIGDQSSYNVGVGTTTPASKIHVMWSNNGASSGQRFSDAGIYENNGNIFFQLHGSATGEKSINFAKPTNGADGALKYNHTGVTGGASGITFWVGGNLYKAAVTSDARLWSSRVLVVGGTSGNDFGRAAILNTNSGEFHYDTIYAEGLFGALFTVRSNGYVGINVAQTAVNNILTVQQNASADPVADAWTVYSSRRWKTNIEPIEEAMDLVKSLQGVSFDWKETGQHDIGLVAEDVGRVIPEVVAYEENGIDAKSVDYARLVAVLIEALKEQQAQIETQQGQIADMEARLTALEKVLSMESASPRPFQASLLVSWPFLAGALVVLVFGLGFRLRK